jgi:hypothetical protein
MCSYDYGIWFVPLLIKFDKAIKNFLPLLCHFFFMCNAIFVITTCDPTVGAYTDMDVQALVVKINVILCLAVALFEHNNMDVHSILAM